MHTSMREEIGANAFDATTVTGRFDGAAVAEQRRGYTMSNRPDAANAAAKCIIEWVLAKVYGTHRTHPFGGAGIPAHPLRWGMVPQDLP
jgi:hypothetical protein